MRTALPLGLRRSWDKSALQYETGGLADRACLVVVPVLSLLFLKSSSMSPPLSPFMPWLCMRKGELLSRGIHCVHLVESYLPASILVLLEV